MNNKIAFGIVALIIMTQGALADDWPMFRHDSMHTGASADIVIPPLTLFWETEIPTTCPAGFWCTTNLQRSPAVSGDMVYVGDNDNLYALDASADGFAKWKYKVSLGTSPAISGGVVYVGSSDGNISALNATTGNLKWKYKTGDYGLSSPAISGGVIYVGSMDGNISALNATTGSLKWKYDTGAEDEEAKEIISSPAVSGGVVYVGSNCRRIGCDGYIYAVDAITGRLKWKFESYSDPITGSRRHVGRISSSPAVSGGIVYIGSHDNNIYAVDAITGGLKWVYETSGDITSSPAIFKFKTNQWVYVGSWDGWVYAFLEDGMLKWKHKIGSPILSSPAISHDVVYIGDSNGNISALDVGTGILEWRNETGDDIASSPAISDDMVYFQTNDSILAFKAKLYDYIYSPLQFAYVTNSSIEKENAVSVIDTQTNRVTDIVPVEFRSFLRKVAVNPDGKNVYFGNFLAEAYWVSIIDTDVNEITKNVRVPGDPNGIAVAPNGKRVYVTNAEGVSIINTTLNKVTKTISVGKNYYGEPLPAFGVAVTNDGKKVYVTTVGDDVLVINTTTFKITNRVPVGKTPREIAVAPYWIKKVYVTNTEGISVINTTLNKVTDTIPVGNILLSWIAVSPDGKRVYVTNTEGISVVDTTLNRVIDTIHVNNIPGGIALTPNGKKIYVTLASDSVLVIDTETNKVTDTIRVEGPSGVAIGPEKEIATVHSIHGNWNINFKPSEGYINNLQVIDPDFIPKPPSGTNFVYGIFSFDIIGVTPGGSVTLTITFPSNLPTDTTYWKYHGWTPSWYSIKPDTIVGNKMILTLTDGGIGDSDNTRNGIISDPGGPSLNGPLPTGSISGSKFEDINSNGKFDSEEPGLTNWTMLLINPKGTVIGATETASDGSYNFTNLTNGSYTVGEVLQPGWIQTAPAVSTTGSETHKVEIKEDNSVKNQDFGNYKLGKISGQKFNDVNGNGLEEVSDTGLSGWRITLTGTDTLTGESVVKKEITDANGNYNFSELIPGTYTIGEVMPSGWIQTAPSVSEKGSAIHTVTITTSGTVIIGEDFGNFKLGEVHGTKFEDLNADSKKDTFETNLAGWEINIKGKDTITGDDVNITTITDANGNYSFTNLTAGTYVISEKLKNGWVQTTPWAGNYTVTITSGANITGQDFGNFHKGKITGSGWIPAPNNPKATFGIEGQYPANSNIAQGNVEYQDHIANLNIKSIRINTVASTLDKKKGVITGFAKVNGAGFYPFEAYFEDNAKPGKGADVFKISLPIYSNGAILSYGNIQIHE